MPCFIISRKIIKVAIITGGGTGIGKAITALFTSEGASVLIGGRRAELLKEVVETYPSFTARSRPSKYAW